MANSSTSSSSLGFFGLLTIVFITLKLTGFIAWSWWWVISPIFAPVIIVLGVILIGIVAGLIGLLLAGLVSLVSKKRRR